jgi:undecaprenyl-diphosphatase
MHPLDLLHRADITLLYTINHAHHPILDILFATLSNTEFFYPFLALISLALIILGKTRGCHLLLTIIIAIIITDKIVIWPIRTAVNRPRPHEVLPNIRSAILELPRVQIGSKSRALPILPTLDKIRIEITPADQAQKPPPAKGRSFLSGHAANNLIIAICTATFFPQLAIPAYTWAFLIAYSRIYNGLHYPSDIILAWLLATLITLAILALHRRLFLNLHENTQVKNR